jgi:hypothetical protein
VQLQGLPKLDVLIRTAKSIRKERRNTHALLKKQTKQSDRLAIQIKMHCHFPVFV